VLDQETIAWAAGRGISQRTLERVGAASGITGFPGLGSVSCIALPYWRGAQIVNIKYRALAAKAFKQYQGGEQRFYNLDAALGADTVYIVEGEMDALSLIEAGFNAVISIPGGADHNLDYVDAAWAEGLAKTKLFVLAGDNDPPGRRCMERLAAKIGPARCATIAWPDKDANDFLVRYNAAELKWHVNHPTPWPIVGLLAMSQISEPPEIETWNTDFHEWGGRIKFARSMVSIVTGQPGHGKTSLFAQIWHGILAHYELVGCFGSFETRPKPQYRRILRQCQFRTNESLLTETQLQQADKWIEEHTRWLAHPTQQPTLEWALDAAEAAVIRDKAAVVQLDPWNRLIPGRGQYERETDYVSRSLDRCLDFAKGLNCHVQIIAHPAKGDFQSRKHYPSLEDISGSKHWDNKADQGLVVWREKLFDGDKRRTDAEIIQLKARYQELGYPCRLPVNLNLMTGCFEAVTKIPVDTNEK